MSKRGGKREGAGRKKGRPNKKTMVAIAKEKAKGMLPHEFLAAVARGETVKVRGGEYNPTFAEMMEAAKAAAPYFASRLASIEAKVEHTERPKTISAEPLTIAEFQALYGSSN